MMRIHILWLILLPLFTGGQTTPLDDYMTTPEPLYSWELIGTYPEDGYTQYCINMTSQDWMTDAETSQPIWYHYVIVVIPDNLTYTDSGFIMVDNGDMDDSVPVPGDDGRYDSTARYAMGMGVVAADLKMIPNQPVHCDGDPVDRTRREDDLIAWTWRRYVDEDGANPDILLRLPMVKATVKAMDTIIEFARAERPETDIQSFMVSGGSKRGWTTYLTAAVDTRVFAIIPSVLSCLNFVEVMNHQYMAYGGWSFSNKDYYFENLTSYMNEPIIQDMMDIVDPYVYRDRLTMPKLIISGVQDEHFMPDDTWYFWDDLVGPKYYWMLEDAGHGISDSKHEERIKTNRIAFFHAVKTGYTLPSLSWERGEDEAQTSGYIIVHSDIEPFNISVVYGDTNTDERRDFRQFVGVPDPSSPTPNPIEWIVEDVEDFGNGTYRATYDIPPSGWRCFFIKMTFEGPNGGFFFTTTETNIIPDYLPYPQCQTPAECQGTLL